MEMRILIFTAIGFFVVNLARTCRLKYAPSLSDIWDLNAGLVATLVVGLLDKVMGF